MGHLVLLLLGPPRFEHDGQPVEVDTRKATAYARRWLLLDPLHEPAHRHLMQLHAWAGNRSAQAKPRLLPD